MRFGLKLEVFSMNSKNILAKRKHRKNKLLLNSNNNNKINQIMQKYKFNKM